MCNDLSGGSKESQPSKDTRVDPTGRDLSIWTGFHLASVNIRRQRASTGHSQRLCTALTLPYGKASPDPLAIWGRVEPALNLHVNGPI